MAANLKDAYDSSGQLVFHNERDEEIVRRTMQDFSECQLYRNTFAAQWEEIAELVLPTSRNTFYYGNYNWPGQKKTDRQVDATGMLVLHRFAAIVDSLVSPRNMLWQALGPEAEDLAKDRTVKEWMHENTLRLFKARYSRLGNFTAQNQNVYTSLGAFGTASMFTDQAVDEAGNLVKALRYKALPLGETFFIENHQGLINTMIRWFRLTAQQAVIQFGKDKLPPTIMAALEKQSQAPFNFLHHICPNSEYAPGRLDAKGKAFASYYVSIEGQCLMGEGGYRTFPVAASRYEQTPGETYGRSPMMMVLPSLKTLNAQKATFLKQGHRAADPVLLTADDGLMDNVSLRPGAMNKGGMTADGKRLVDILPTGNIQINKEMMDEERSIIKDVGLVSLFQILTETPTMTATEVIERVNEKGILIAPTVGRQYDEYHAPRTERELDLMSQMGMLTPMPPVLREAGGAYHIVATGPIARQQRAGEAAGFLRTVEQAKEIFAVTQDAAIFDPFSFDRAIPAIAEINVAPIEWMATDDEIGAKRKNRQAAQEQAQKIQALPAQAAMMKAQAVAGAAQQQQGGGGQPGQPPADQGQFGPGGQ